MHVNASATEWLRSPTCCDYVEVQPHRMQEEAVKPAHEVHPRLRGRKTQA